jgi:hypothetical protein
MSVIPPIGINPLATPTGRTSSTLLFSDVVKNSYVYMYKNSYVYMYYSPNWVICFSSFHPNLFLMVVSTGLKILYTKEFYSATHKEE